MTEVTEFSNVDSLITYAINTALFVLIHLHLQLIWVWKWWVWILRSVIPSPLRADYILKFNFKGFIQYHNMSKKSYILQLMKVKYISLG